MNLLLPCCHCVVNASNKNQVETRISLINADYGIFHHCSSMVQLWMTEISSTVNRLMKPIRVPHKQQGKVKVSCGECATDNWIRVADW